MTIGDDIDYARSKNNENDTIISLALEAVFRAEISVRKIDIYTQLYELTKGKLTLSDGVQHHSYVSGWLRSQIESGSLVCIQGTSPVEYTNQKTITLARN